MLFYILAAIGGYVAAVFTWDRLHTFFVGVENKAAQLRQKAKDLLAKV